MKRKLVISVLIFFIIVVIVGLVIVLNKNESIENGINEEDWLTYQNEKYKFSFQYPPDWKVFVEDRSNKEPIINVYPVYLQDKPPFIHHSKVPNVSVFPKGVPTEGVIGMVATSTVTFEEITVNAIDFILVDGERWATFATFEEHPSSWEDFGFIWARTPILDHVQSCLDQFSATVPTERCNGLGDMEISLSIRDEGRVDKKQQNIEEKILENFRFTE